MPCAISPSLLNSYKNWVLSRKSLEHYKMLLLYSDPDKGQLTIFKYKAIGPLKLRANQLTCTLKGPNLSITLISFTISFPEDF